MRRTLIALAALLAVPTSAAAATAGSGRLHPDGRWLRDDKGRVVIIHGLQVAHKTAPYEPSAESFETNASPAPLPLSL